MTHENFIKIAAMIMLAFTLIRFIAHDAAQVAADIKSIIIPEAHAQVPEWIAEDYESFHTPELHHIGMDEYVAQNEDKVLLHRTFPCHASHGNPCYDYYWYTKETSIFNSIKQWLGF